METNTPKPPIPLGACKPLSNTPIPWPTPLTTPNGIWIQSAMLPQYTFWANRQTDWLTDRLTDGIGDKCVPRTLTLSYIDREWCTNNTLIIFKLTNQCVSASMVGWAVTSKKSIPTVQMFSSASQIKTSCFTESGTGNSGSNNDGQVSHEI